MIKPVGGQPTPSTTQTSPGKKAVASSDLQAISKAVTNAVQPRIPSAGFIPNKNAAKQEKKSYTAISAANKFAQAALEGIADVANQVFKPKKKK